MSVDAISSFVTSTSRLIPPNYMKVTAGMAAVIGLVISAVRNMQLSRQQSLVDASAKGKRTLDELNPKLEGWESYDAKALCTILHSEDLCDANDPRPLHQQMGRLNSAFHFQEAAAHIKTLTDIATKVSKVQDAWLKETKDEALKWINAKDQLGCAVRGALKYKLNVNEKDKVIRELLAIMHTTKNEIKKDGVKIETIQAQMAEIKDKYEAIIPQVNEDETEITVAGKTKNLQNWFSEPDERLQELSSEDLNHTYTTQGTVADDDKENVDKAIAGLKEENLLKAVDKEKEGPAKAAADEVEKWTKPDSGFYTPLWACTGLALATLAANWGAPRYLGPDHHIVQFMKWPA